MKAQQIRGTAVALAALFAAVTALAATPTLKVGDPAPKLQTGKWIQGDPVNELPAGKACIVEFWATWCGPCRTSIPHLNEIYTKFKDKGLVVIGQDCWERDDSLVAPFVTKMGTNMTYRVALDENGKMASTWMAAAGLNSIPTAFLVDGKGRIAWIGHPMNLKETLIEEALAGTLDLAKAAADYEQEQKKEALVREASMALSRAMQDEKWDEAMDKVADLQKLLPAEEMANLDMVRFGILLKREDYPAAYKMAAKISDANKNEPAIQNSLARQIVTEKGIKDRDLKLAETFAMRANDAAKGKNPAVLDTLARVKFMLGDKAQAVSLQEKAMSLAGKDGEARYQAALDSYKKGELPGAE